MIIQKTRIRNSEKYLGFLPPKTKFFLGLPVSKTEIKNISRMGFSPKLVSGETIVPALLGPISTFNAEGKIEKQKHLPMETAYRTVNWEWKDWGGGLHSRLVDVSYKRYPQKEIPPVGIQLKLVEKEGEYFVISPLFEKGTTDSDILTHTINLFLELFGGCSIHKKDLEAFIKAPTKKLNWEVLPPGEYPFSRVMNDAKKMIEANQVKSPEIVLLRLKTMEELNPDFIAQGTAGFYGYRVFGFKEKSIYIMESLFRGNATYIFGEDWKTLSQKTKAEILRDDLQIDRIVHRANWRKEILAWAKKNL